MTRAAAFAGALLWFVAGFPSVAAADPVRVFADRGQFGAQVGRVAVETFGPGSCLSQNRSSLDAATGIQCSPDHRLKSAVTYQADDQLQNRPWPGVVIDGGGGGFEGGFISSIRSETVPASALTVLFERPVAAFGFDTNRLMGSSFTLTIDSFQELPTETFTVEPTFAPQFFGFQRGSADIRRIVISGSGMRLVPDRDLFTGFAVDNFTFGGTGFDTLVTPEPATLTLLMIGMGASWAGRAIRSQRRASKEL